MTFLDKPHFGATFSRPHFEELGLDWRACLEAMQAAFPPSFNTLRIGAYWSELEPSRGQFNWSRLDEVLEAVEAQDRYGVVLSVGMKAPRYPEYYIPKWACPNPPAKYAEITKEPGLDRQALMDFVSATVLRYRDNPLIKAWQVENEPMDRAGDSKWFIGADFVLQEALLIRRLAGNRPLIINCWSELQSLSSAPWGLDEDYAVRNAVGIADVLGLDCYITVDSNQADYTYRCKVLPKRYLAGALQNGKRAWIAESQAEPWGNPPIGPKDIQWLVEQHIQIGFRGVLLWGLEYWWQQLAKNGDRTLFDHVLWETRRFSILSRVYPEWTTRFATNLAGGEDGKLYLTVVGQENGIWLFSSPDSGDTWSSTRVPDANWITLRPVGLANHAGRLRLTVVGSGNNEAWLLTQDGPGWNVRQVNGNWQTRQAMGVLSYGGTLFLTLVGYDNDQAFLLWSNDDGQSFAATQINGNWQTKHAIGIAQHQGRIYLTVIGYSTSTGGGGEIYLVSCSPSDPAGTWSTVRVLGDAGWGTRFPVSVSSHAGRLQLAIVGNQSNEIELLSSGDRGQSWQVDSGIFRGWQTNSGMCITEVSSGDDKKLHLSLVGATEGEIYVCTGDPRLPEGPRLLLREEEAAAPLTVISP